MKPNDIVYFIVDEAGVCQKGYNRSNYVYPSLRGAQGQVNRRRKDWDRMTEQQRQWYGSNPHNLRVVEYRLEYVRDVN